MIHPSYMELMEVNIRQLRFSISIVNMVVVMAFIARLILIQALHRRLY